LGGCGSTPGAGGDAPDLTSGGTGELGGAPFDLSATDQSVPPERGTLGGHAAAVLSDGPHGSGHYWDLTLAITLEGRTLGACWSTSTSGWRNLPDEGRRKIGRWHVLVEDRLNVWSTLVAGAAESESLIIPLVFRLAADKVQLDRPATLKEIDRVGRVYATVATRRDDPAPEMHRAAAAAYRSVVADTGCE
jgi:hypothetical protein